MVTLMGKNLLAENGKLTEIPVGMFENRTDLTAITIPPYITKIGRRAFKRCKFTEVNIPEGVVSIGGDAFPVALTKITVPKSLVEMPYPITYNSDVYYNGTINDWLNINSPRGVLGGKVVPQNLYFQNEKVMDITIPDTCTSIPEYAFNSLGNINSITIPNSVVNIGDYAFFRDIPTEVNIDFSNVETIGDYALPSIKLNTVSLPNIKSIGEAALANFNITSITFGDGLESLSGLALAYNNFTEIVIPKNTLMYYYRPTVSDSSNDETMGPLWHNMNLERLEFPLVKIYADDRFGEIFGTNTTSNTDWIYQGTDMFGDDIYAYIPTTLKYVKINNGTKIPERYFYGCTMLEEIELVNTIIHIDDYAFYGCSNLTKISIPGILTGMSTNTFKNCQKLTTIISGNTKAFWQEVPKSIFYGVSGPITIKCSDGDLTITL